MNKEKSVIDDMILHVDGDSFFASCEVSWRPELRGKPVVVGEERGIASAMTKEAKKLGIQRAKPIFEIRKEFPEVTILPSHFDLYESYSERLYTILSAHLECVEWYSIDECFALMPASFAKKYGSWEAALVFLKHEVQSRLGITFSFGLASTKPLAKVASSVNKPDGMYVLYEKDCTEKLQQTEIGDVWGIGWKLSSRLRKMNISNAYEFIEYPLGLVERNFSAPTVGLWHELQGRRMHGVHGKHGAQKSLQATRSFKASFDQSLVYSELSRNIEIVCRRLREQKMMTKSISVFIKPKHIIRSRASVQIQLSAYTQNPKDMLMAVEPYFHTIYKHDLAYRSTGVGVYRLIPQNRIQEDLFGFNTRKSEKDTYLSVLDSLQDRMGKGIVNLGSSMKSIAYRKIEQSDRDSRDPYLWNLPLPYMGETV